MRRSLTKRVLLRVLRDRFQFKIERGLMDMVEVRFASEVFNFEYVGGLRSLEANFKRIGKRKALEWCRSRVARRNALSPLTRAFDLFDWRLEG